MMHKLAHWLGLNFGTVVTAYDRHNNLWMGFRCTGCGKVTCKALNSFYHPAPGDEDFRS